MDSYRNGYYPNQSYDDIISPAGPGADQYGMRSGVRSGHSPRPYGRLPQLVTGADRYGQPMMNRSMYPDAQQVPNAFISPAGPGGENYRQVAAPSDVNRGYQRPSYNVIGQAFPSTEQYGQFRMQSNIGSSGHQRLLNNDIRSAHPGAVAYGEYGIQAGRSNGEQSNSYGMIRSAYPGADEYGYYSNGMGAMQVTDRFDGLALHYESQPEILERLMREQPLPAGEQTAGQGTDRRMAAVSAPQPLPIRRGGVWQDAEPQRRPAVSEQSFRRVPEQQLGPRIPVDSTEEWFSTDLTDEEIISAPLPQIIGPAILQITQTRSVGQIGEAIMEAHGGDEISLRELRERLYDALSCAAIMNGRTYREVRERYVQLYPRSAAVSLRLDPDKLLPQSTPIAASNAESQTDSTSVNIPAHSGSSSAPDETWTNFEQEDGLISPRTTSASIETSQTKPPAIPAEAEVATGAEAAASDASTPPSYRFPSDQEILRFDLRDICGQALLQLTETRSVDQVYELLRVVHREKALTQKTLKKRLRTAMCQIAADSGRSLTEAHDEYTRLFPRSALAFTKFMEPRESRKAPSKKPKPMHIRRCSLSAEQILEQDPDRLRDDRLLQVAMDVSNDDIWSAVAENHGKGKLTKAELKTRMEDAYQYVADRAGVHVFHVRAEFHRASNIRRKGDHVWVD